MSYQLHQGDLLTILPTLPADSVALTFFSPPYEDCRTYDVDFKLKGQEYVDWMVKVFKKCLRITTGLVACVIEGKTEDFRYSATPALLMADLHRAGVNLRKPPIFHRIGIPGSGGPDWLRNDYEWIICATRGGKLLWSDNTAMGHKPKWTPGGEMSHRLTDGTRRNQWGGCAGPRGNGNRNKHGEIERSERPSHKVETVAETKKRITRGKTDGDTQDSDSYDPPAIANPGNRIEQRYTVQEVTDLISYYERGDLRHHIVGGGVMGGDEYCSQNEAPFPEALPEFFVRSFCPPGGTVCDPTMGSGTTGAVAIRWQRNFIGIDVRQSQVDLARLRLENETPMMFV